MPIGPALLFAVAGPILGPQPTSPSQRLLDAGAILGLQPIQQSSQSPPPPEPYRKAGEKPLDFRGPGRDTPEPEVDEVVIGWFGPGDPDHREFGDHWRGAVLALEQENAAGGYRGKPFRIVPAWSESPWKAGILDVTKLVYEQGAWAVIGGVDGTTTHLAVQLALKSRFLLLSPGSTDVTADLANVPWLFSLPPSDEVLAPVIAESVGTAAGRGRFAIVAATDHDSHATLVAVRRALESRRLSASALVELPQADADPSAAVQQLLSAKPKAVVAIASSTTSARLVVELRRAGYAGAILGGPTAGLHAFQRAAGEAAEGVLAPSWLDTSTPEWRRFVESYTARWGAPPDAASAQGHDAIRLVAAAVRAAGLNRARIRDAVRALAPWRGAAGTVAWNALGRNEAAVSQGVWRGGAIRGSKGPSAGAPAPRNDDRANRWCASATRLGMFETAGGPECPRSGDPAALRRPGAGR
jgi:branched-chain amino acid transport system substrate-binding protein